MCSSDLHLSSQALYYDKDRFNRAKIIVYPEIKKVMDNTAIETTKGITEGRDQSRKVAISRKQGADTLTLSSNGKTVNATLSTRNKLIGAYDRDFETRRRFAALRVDESPAHWSQIRAFEADVLTDEDKEMAYVCPRAQFEDLTEWVQYSATLRFNSIFDPGFQFIDKYIPLTGSSIAYNKHYRKAVEGIAMLNFQKALIFGALIPAPQDHFMAYRVFYNAFCRSLIELEQVRTGNLAPTGPDGLIDWRSSYAHHLQSMMEKLRGEKNLSSDLEDRANRLTQPIDWKAFYDSWIAKIREKFSSAQAEEIENNVLLDGQLIAYDPVQRQNVVLARIQDGNGR